MEELKISEDLKAVREMFTKDRFATEAAGVEIIEIGDRYAKCKLELNEIHYNAVGAVMGGAIFTLADFNFAVATNFKQVPTVTLSSSIQFLSGVRGKTLYSESRLIKDGRRNCFYEIIVTDELGTSVALVSITGAHLQ